MSTRWEVTKAVRSSGLPSPARLLMLVLADVAEVGTAEIPERFTPSVSVLVRETGLGRSTVQRYLDLLEADGWIKRDRPSKKAQWFGERVRYFLLVPEFSEVDEEEPERDEGGPAETPGVVPERDQGSPRATDTGSQSGTPNQILTNPDPSSSAPPPSKKPTRKPEPPRDDVSQLCDRLAQHIVDNGGDPPDVSDEWRRQARLLLDKDGRELDKALALIDWCQADEFWHTNILSMSKFRKKYNELRLKAVAEWKKGKTSKFETPKSSAPEAVPADQKCEDHRRPLPCSLCKSEQTGRRNAA